MAITKLDTQAIQLPADTTANRPGSPSVGMMRFNTTLDTAEIYTPAGWAGFGSTLGTSGNPATSGAALYASNPSLPDGLYWFKNSGGTLMQTWCDITNGGWVLVASNNASSGTIPGGSGRNDIQYALNRNGASSLGTPSPNDDWIIGTWLDTFSFTSARVVGFGRSSTNGTTSWTSKGTFIDSRFNLSTTGTSRYTEVITLANVTTTGNSSINGAAAYWVLDGIRADFNRGGSVTANSSQTTIGVVGVASSSGDPTDGCYTGHGASEGNYEGWYDSSGSNADCQGYTTWVK
jgi:hypothetical protein